MVRPTSSPKAIGSCSEANEQLTSTPQVAGHPIDETADGGDEAPASEELVSCRSRRLLPTVVSRMKVSARLPREDVDFLDNYVKERGMHSRSAALQRAVGLLRHEGLEGAYTAALTEWSDQGEGDVWAVVAADGLRHESR